MDVLPGTCPTVDFPFVLVVRDPARAPALPGARVAMASYADRESMIAALEGVAHALPGLGP